MAFLMFMVALAVHPDSLPIFEIIHRPMNSFVEFLDSSFHFIADNDSDAHYVRYWLTSLLCYWPLIGSVIGLFFGISVPGRLASRKVGATFFASAWLFVAGVLARALFTIHSYDGDWGLAQDVSTGILVGALILIALQLGRIVRRGQGGANKIAAHEPPLPGSSSSAPIHRTLASLPVFVSGGGR